MREIIICATQRCGSTMIIEDMRNTSVLGRPEEWFLPWDPEKTNITWASALEKVRKRATGPNGVVAIKVMANQLFNIDACMSGFVKPGLGNVFPHFAETFRDACWVRLTRRDVVAQAISRVMSRQTGVSHATARPEDEHFAGKLTKGYDPDYNKNTVYKYGPILAECTAITLENLAWSRFFECYRLRPVEFIHEDVVADAEMHHLDVMADLVGIDGTVPRTARKMVKIGNARNEEWRERFFHDAAQNKFRRARRQPNSLQGKGQ